MLTKDTLEHAIPVIEHMYERSGRTWQERLKAPDTYSSQDIAQRIGMESATPGDLEAFAGFAGDYASELRMKIAEEHQLTAKYDLLNTGPWKASAKAILAGIAVAGISYWLDHPAIGALLGAAIGAGITTAQCCRYSTVKKQLTVPEHQALIWHDAEYKQRRDALVADYVKRAASHERRGSDSILVRGTQHA